jgi:hypothetical protein
MITREVEQRWKTFLEGQRAGTALAGVPVFTTLPSNTLEYPCILVKAYDAKELFTQDPVVEMLVDVSVISMAKADGVWHLAHKALAEALTTILDEPTYFVGSFYPAGFEGIYSSWLAQVPIGASYFDVEGLSFENSANFTRDTFTFKMAIGPGALVTEGGYIGGCRLVDFSYRHQWEDLFSNYFAGELTQLVKDKWQIVPSYYGGELPANRIVCQFVSADRDKQNGTFFDSNVGPELPPIARTKTYRAWKNALFRFMVVSDRSNIAEEDHLEAVSEVKNLIRNTPNLVSYMLADFVPPFGNPAPRKRLAVLSGISRDYSETQEVSAAHISDTMQVSPNIWVRTPTGGMNDYG